MIVTYDREADAAYIYLDVPKTGSVANTLVCDDTEAAGSFYLDIDKSGRLVGIEVLSAKRALPESLLATAIPAGQILATLEIRK